jgi:hypothetical protein
MKNYVKVVQAVQYLGDVNALKEILSKKDVVLDSQKNVYLLKESGFVEAGYWRLVETDYVVKENGTITVYKKDKFEADFDEVITTDNNLFEATGMVTEIEVKEVEVVKPAKKVASQVVDKSKKV